MRSIRAGTWIRLSMTSAIHSRSFQQCHRSDRLAVSNGLVARLAADAGFNMLYLSGAALAAARCLPDIGLINSLELAEAARQVVRSAAFPLIVDVDTGGGSATNGVRAAPELYEA